MSSRSAPTYVVDPGDPRAPSLEVWQSLTDDERRRIVDELPSEFPVTEETLPDGNAHYRAKVDVEETLSRHFERLKRRVYLACELPVYYPGERMFAPDVMAVLDVELRSREGWVVSAEGKGLDLALEIHVTGRRLKDFQRNVQWFARLGIREYFVFDRKKRRLRGFRLPDDGAKAFEAIVPQGGRFESRVLGLDLLVEGDRLRFCWGEACLPDAGELIGRLRERIDDLEARGAEAAERAEEETRRREEEARLREAAEERVRQLLAEIERLKANGAT